MLKIPVTLEGCPCRRSRQRLSNLLICVVPYLPMMVNERWWHFIHGRWQHLVRRFETFSRLREKEPKGKRKLVNIAIHSSVELFILRAECDCGLMLWWFRRGKCGIGNESRVVERRLSLTSAALCRMRCFISFYLHGSEKSGVKCGKLKTMRKFVDFYWSWYVTAT